jgi:hypothetical protein
MAHFKRYEPYNIHIPDGSNAKVYLMNRGACFAATDRSYGIM